MRTVNMHEAKTHFSKLIEAVLHGEQVLIAKAGKPVARLEPIPPIRPKRKFGVLKGKVKIASDFDEPLSDEIISEFEK